MNRDGEHAEGSSLLSPASGLKRRWDSEIQWPGGIEAPDGTYIDPQKRRYVSGSTTLAGSVALGSSCWGEPIPLPSFPPALESTASTELTTLNSNVLYNIPSQPLSDSYELSTEQLEQYVSGYCQLFNYAGNANTTWSASGFPTSQVPVGWLSGQSSGSSEQNCVNSIETSTTLGSYNYDIAVSENLFPTQSYSGNQELAQHDVTDPPAHTTSADFLAVSNAGRQQHHNWSFSTDVSPYDSSQTPVISPPSVSAFTPGHHSQAPAFELQDPGMASASGENSRLGSALSPAQDASVFTASTTVSDPQDSTGLGKDQYEYDCCFGLVIFNTFQLGHEFLGRKKVKEVSLKANGSMAIIKDADTNAYGGLLGQDEARVVISLLERHHVELSASIKTPKRMEVHIYGWRKESDAVGDTLLEQDCFCNEG